MTRMFQFAYGGDYRWTRASFMGRSAPPISSFDTTLVINGTRVCA